MTEKEYYTLLGTDCNNAAAKDIWICLKQNELIIISRPKLVSLLLRITDESVPLFSSDRLHNLHKDIVNYLSNELK